MNIEPKVTLTLREPELKEIIAYWLEGTQGYTMTEDEKKSVRFNLGTGGDQRETYKVFSNATMNLSLGFNNFKR